MKKFIVGSILTYLLIMIPWRLLLLGVGVLVNHPGYVQTRTDNDDYWKAKDLEWFLTSKGWEVKYFDKKASEMDDVYGLTSYHQHTIFIDDSLSWSARYDVMVHEGAHTLQSPWYGKGQEEVFAESVAYLVGHENLGTHSRYLSGFKGDFMFMLMFESNKIYAAADLLRR